MGTQVNTAYRCIWLSPFFLSFFLESQIALGNRNTTKDVCGPFWLDRLRGAAGGVGTARGGSGPGLAPSTRYVRQRKSGRNRGLCGRLFQEERKSGRSEILQQAPIGTTRKAA